MGRSHTKYTKELLEKVAAKSESVAEMMRHLDLRPAGGTHWHLSKKLKKYEIDTSHFLGKASNRGKPSANKLKSDLILVYDRLEGRKEKAYKLRRALIESGIEHKCKICSLDPIWEGRELRLQVDHIDGDVINNRKENLRFICPNCHSQTDNFGSYAFSKNDRYCLKKDCSNTVSYQSQSGLCESCSKTNRRSTGPSITRRTSVTIRKGECTVCGNPTSRPQFDKCRPCSQRRITLNSEELESCIWSKPIQEVAKDLGVSDVAVHKACKRLGIKKPPQGYWLRKTTKRL